MAAIPEAVTVKIGLDNAVVVRPGDKLVYATPNRLSMQDADTIKAKIAKKLPGVEVVIISECTGLAVYRDEPTVRKVSQVLTVEEVGSLRERGVIDNEGKTFGDRVTDYLEAHPINQLD